MIIEAERFELEIRVVRIKMVLEFETKRHRQSNITW